MKDKDYVMPLKAVILRQIESVIEKAINFYCEEDILDPPYLKSGYYSIAADLEFILQNIDLIEFKESFYKLNLENTLKKREDKK